ncbi:MAG: hypothetical protein KDC98_13980 [Planctomycetes bacterium]|nr:hypothetical protein [Planctomycetota bacterium]
MDLESAIWEVFQALLRRAKKGDVQAAKLLLDRLCEDDPVAVEVTYRPLSTEERAARIEAILSIARQRQSEATSRLGSPSSGVEPAGS